MDPNTGQIFSPGAIRELERQANERVADIEARKLVKRLVPIRETELAAVERMDISQRKDWAKARNERKRRRQGR